MYEECISNVVKGLRKGRKGGARDFYIRGDFKNEEEELTNFYGPLCWQGYDKDPGGFKKKLWYGIMKEFDCKVSSTWSVCGKVRAEVFYAQALGERQEGRSFAAGLHHQPHEKK